MPDHPDQPTVEQLLTVDTRRAGQAEVVVVSGEIDVLTVPRLRAAIDDAFHAPACEFVVLDLAGVTFLGSSGLSVLVEAVTEARQREQPLRLVVGNAKPVIRPLQLTGLDQLMALYETLDDALAG